MFPGVGEGAFNPSLTSIDLDLGGLSYSLFNEPFLEHPRI